jgi:hypothetical protein
MQLARWPIATLPVTLRHTGHSSHAPGRRNGTAHATRTGGGITPPGGWEMGRQSGRAGAAERSGVDAPDRAGPAEAFDADAVIHRRVTTRSA